MRQLLILWSAQALLWSGQALLWSGQALLFGLSPQYGYAESKLPVATSQKDKFDKEGSGLRTQPDQSRQLSTASQLKESAPIPQRSPGQLLRTLLATSPENRLPGKPRSLADVLRQDGVRQDGVLKAGPAPLSRQDQTVRIQAYWDLSAAIAQDALVQLERIELQALHAGIQTPGAGWKQAFAETQDQSRVARRSAQVAQYKLLQLSFTQPQMTLPYAGLPVPTDHPHCGVYDTRYDQIFQNRPSEFAWQLHQLLGNQYQQLVRLTVAVESATNRRQQVSMQRQVQSDGSELLRAHENLKLQRRQFIVAVHTYNRTIADYSQLALPNRIKARQLVTMLIYVEPNKSSSQERQPMIERTSGELGLSSQSSNGPSQSTNPREHSILVPDNTLEPQH